MIARLRKYAAVIAVCEQNSAEDMGFTPDALKISFQSLGFRVTRVQKVLHTFSAGEVKSQADTLKESFQNGIRLKKLLNPSL